MDWKDVGSLVSTVVGTGAPLLGGLLGGPAGAAVGGIIAKVLGCDNTPDAIHAAIAADPQAALKLAEIESNNKVELERLLVQSEQNQLSATTIQMQTVNETMRAEVAARTFSWRDYWGFTSGTAFAFVVLVVIYMVVMAVSTNHYEILAYISQIVGAFATLFGLAAAVLGVPDSISAHHTGVCERIKASGTSK